jgi:hypothetical protein
LEIFIVARIGGIFAGSGRHEFCSDQGDTVLLMPRYCTIVGWFIKNMEFPVLCNCWFGLRRVWLVHM